MLGAHEELYKPCLHISSCCSCSEQVILTCQLGRTDRLHVLNDRQVLTPQTPSRGSSNPASVHPVFLPCTHLEALIQDAKRHHQEVGVQQVFAGLDLPGVHLAEVAGPHDGLHLVRVHVCGAASHLGVARKLRGRHPPAIRGALQAASIQSRQAGSILFYWGWAASGLVSAISSGKNADTTVCWSSGSSRRRLGRGNC